MKKDIYFYLVQFIQHDCKRSKISVIISKIKHFGQIIFLPEMPKKQEVYLDELSSLPQWAGRKHHLAELPLAGNGEITMKDKATGETIYRTSFSSLFQEWVSEEEASRIKRGFENSFLLPYPKKEAVVTISLKDVYHKVNASLTHEIIPNDILIHQRGTNHITPHRYLLAKRKCRRLHRCSKSWQKDIQKKRWIYFIKMPRRHVTPVQS